MSKIVVVKPDSVSERDLQLLREAGYIVITAKNTSDVKVIDEFAQLTHNETLDCALEALSWGNDATSRNAFGELMRKALRVKLKESK